MMKRIAPPKLRKFPAAKQRRLDKLLDKNSEGTITPKEKALLERLVADAEELMVANAKQLAEFSTTVAGLVALHDWLEAHRVREVAMEATGVFWKPVWAVLEDRFACILVNARHVKQVALV